MSNLFSETPQAYAHLCFLHNPGGVFRHVLLLIGKWSLGLGKLLQDVKAGSRSWHRSGCSRATSVRQQGDVVLQMQDRPEQCPHSCA